MSVEPTYHAIAAAIDRAATEAAREAATVAAGWAKESARSTPDSAGHVGRYDRGTFIKSIVATEPVDRGTYVEARVISRDRPEKVNVLEDGRRPGKPVSVEGRRLIRGWVERKLLTAALLKSDTTGKAKPKTKTTNGVVRVVGVTGVSKSVRERTLDSLTYLVVRKIRTKGTPGIHVMATTRARFEGPEGKAIIEEALARFLGGAS